MSPLFAPYFALKVVRGYWGGCGGAPRSGGGTQSLDNGYEYFSGSFLKLVPPKRFQFFDSPKNVFLVFFFRRFHKVGLGFFFGHRSDFLQIGQFLLFNAFYFFFFLFQFFYAVFYLGVVFVYGEPLFFKAFFSL